jgi:selenocysteine-specific elongation factor
MHVVATAGHVDHGKSTLVRALTGTDPDRLAEEKRRGLTTDLGFAWMPLRDTEVAFVDVPGHERFVPTMLAGVGPVPAALLVVAADGGWMPQSTEHLDALDALGVRHGLLVVTRADLADPAAATSQAREHLAGTSLAGIEAVAVSAVTGAGLDELRSALTRLVDRLPTPDPAAPVRLWVDRAFTVRGAGTVVTGTLPAGTLRTGDHLVLPGGPQATVRGLQSLGRPADEVRAVARVAVNLRGVAVSDVSRGDALTTPGTHRETATVDVRLTSRPAGDLPSQCLLHTGSAQVAVHVRPLGSDTARLRLRSPLPLRIGDVGLLRDPGRHLVLGGVTVLDVAPPALRRRGSGRARADELATMGGSPDAAGELSRRRVVRRADLLAMGVAAGDVDALAPGRPEWLVDPAHAEELAARLGDELRAHLEQHPLEAGMPTDALRQRLSLPAASLVAALVRPPLALAGGRVVDTRRAPSSLPESVAAAVAELRRELAETPYAAPEAHRLRDLGLGPKELAAAVRAGELAPVAEGVYLTPEALRDALAPLRALPQPFSLSEARQAWGTSRRVAVPLLERLDRLGVTERLPDDRRRVRAQTSTSASTRGTSGSSSRARNPSGPT